MDLFYATPPQIDLKLQRVVIDGGEFHHITRVLRNKPGDTIQVTDGRGLLLEVLIDEAGKHSLEGTIQASRLVPIPETSVTVAISTLRAPQRFDFFLEKATELGVSEIIPMITARTVSTPSPEKIEKKVERWQNVVLAASRQCKRCWLPTVHAPVSFRQAAALEGYDLKLMPYESSVTTPAMGSVAGRRILFLIGGEGGFTEEEVRSASRAGFREISFGRTILRAETAGIFAVAMVRTILLDGDAEQWL